MSRTIFIECPKAIVILSTDYVNGKPYSWSCLTERRVKTDRDNYIGVMSYLSAADAFRKARSMQP